MNTGNRNFRAVAEAIRFFDPDLVVLEEVNSQWLSDLQPMLAGFAHVRSAPREDNFGIGIWSRFPAKDSRIVYIGQAGVPSIHAEFETPAGRLTVLATHPLPPAGREYSELRNNQLACLPEWVRQASSPVVLLGDLNVTPWNRYFRRLLREAGLRDSAQGRRVYPTWPAYNPLLYIPLDHCLYSGGVQIVDRQTGPRVGSDHLPVIVDFRLLQGAGVGDKRSAADGEPRDWMILRPVSSAALQCP